MTAPATDTQTWQLFADELRRRRTDAIMTALASRGILKRKSSANRNRETDDDTKDSDSNLTYLGRRLSKTRPWLAAFKTPGDTTMLAYFVFAWGMAMWEGTGDHTKVRDNVTAAVDAYSIALAEARPDGGLEQFSEEERKLVELILFDLTAPPPDRPATYQPATTAITWAPSSMLLDAMSVEASIYSGSTGAVKNQAKAIEERSAKILENELTDPYDNAPGAGEINGIHDFLRHILLMHKVYYHTLSLVTDALQSAANSSSSAHEDITIAENQLPIANEVLKGDVLASEFAAYRAVLAGWRERLDKPPAVVELDSVDVTYVYPFTVPSVASHPMKKIEKLILSRGASLELGGLKPTTEAYRVELSDLWTWGGRGDCLQASICLPMPPVDVHIPGEDDSHLRYSAELRFNRLGNHYLRLRTTLTRPDLASLNHALRRATAYAGEQHVESGSVEPWTSIADYADSVISDAGSWLIKTQQRIIAQRQARAEAEAKKNASPAQKLRDALKRDNKSPEATVSKPAKPVVGFDANLDYHVIVAIRKASVADPGEKPNKECEQAIIANFGPVLSQSLNREVTALDEWICWDDGPAPTNLLGDDRLPADFALGTEHSTVLCMQSTPDWSHAGFLEVAEFSGSLPTLMRQWKVDFDTSINAADKAVSDEGDDDHISDEEEELNRVRTTLRKYVSYIRDQQFYLIPSRLVSLRAERTFLTSLYDLADIPRSTDDIDAALRRGDIAIQRITTREEHLRERRNIQYQNRLQNTLYLVSLFSFSSVLALFAEIYYGAEVPGLVSQAPVHDEASHSMGHLDGWIAAALYLALVIVSLTILYLSKRKFLKEPKRDT